MAKELDITPRIEARIKARAGDEIDISNLAVFETRAASTKPLYKLGSIYHKGRITSGTLREMAAGLNDGTYSVAIQVMHNTDILPNGKAFYAEVLERQDGDSELRVQFYLPRDTDGDLIAKINSSVVDEVSVGMMAKSLLCSECGFDFFSEESLRMGNLWMREDPEGHVIGEDGVHTISSGLDQWFELSLVGKGAARDPKILSRTEARLSADVKERMAASGTPVAARLLLTSFEKDSSMTDISPLVASLAALSASEAVAKAELTVASAEVTRLTAALAVAEGKVTSLEAAAASAPGADVVVERDAAKAELKLATDFLFPEAKKALVASGAKDAEEPKDVAGAITALTASATNLVNTLVANGKSVPAGDGKEPIVLKRDFSAFKSAPINASR